MGRSAIEEIFKNLREHGSWIGTFDYKKLFDPYDDSFHETPTREKLLELKEFNFCGLGPLMLSIRYRDFCKEERRQDIYFDLDQALLEIINSITQEDVSNLDIHNSSNWYRGSEDNPKTTKIHFVIKNTLAKMSPEFHKKLISQKDLLIRKRLILAHYSLYNYEIKVVENNDPIFDKIDEELLARVETYDKNDEDKRAFTIEQLVWDLYEEISNKKIDDPLSWYNWYMDTESDSPFIKQMHYVIRHTLEYMSSYHRQLLVEQTDNQLRKRLILIYNSMKNEKQKFVENNDPLLDKIDEELLNRVDLLSDESSKHRQIALEEMVEDLHDEFDPEYKNQKQEYAQRLVTCIEGLLVEELKTMDEFRGYNLEFILEAKKDPKEWLYSKVSWEIKREVDKIRPKNE